MKINIFLILFFALFTGCSKSSSKPHASQFSNCPRELVKPQSYCGFKRYWNKGSLAMANLFEITFHADCTADYSFHNVLKDLFVTQVTCGKADWGLDHENLIIEPGFAWVGVQNLGPIKIDNSKIYLQDEPTVVFESPCPFVTVNRLCN